MCDIPKKYFWTSIFWIGQLSPGTIMNLSNSMKSNLASMLAYIIKIIHDNFQSNIFHIFRIPLVTQVVQVLKRHAICETPWAFSKVIR